jgi:predicted  nucleic acid-binding Zn-ribbon protein
MMEIEVTEEQAERLAEQMENEVDRMENTLNSFRSNDLTHTEGYKELEEEKRVLELDIDNVREQIDEQSSEGLEELFA